MRDLIHFEWDRRQRADLVTPGETVAAEERSRRASAPHHRPRVLADISQSARFAMFVKMGEDETSWVATRGSGAVRNDASLDQPSSTTEAHSSRRIIDVAAELFLERGVDGGSLRQIADVVGMKAGSIYYHFASKNDLLVAIFERGIAMMIDAFDEATVASAGSLGSERFNTHVRAHLAALYESGPCTAAQVSTFRTAPAVVREAAVPSRDSYEAKWTELITELVATGDLQPRAVDGVHRLLLFGAMNTSIEWFDIERGTLDTLAEAITQQFWSGLAQHTQEAT